MTEFALKVSDHLPGLPAPTSTEMAAGQQHTGSDVSQFIWTDEKEIISLP